MLFCHTMDCINQVYQMKRILLAFVIILLLAITGFAVWGLTPQGPMAEVNPYLQNSQAVAVDNSKWLAFIPTEYPPSKTGFILYPGGHVSYRSYAPVAYKLAEKGVKEIIEMQHQALGSRM